MNVKTRHFHGLKAAQKLVETMAHWARSGEVQLGSCWIDLDSGDKHKLKPEEYLELAEKAIRKSINDMKAGDPSKSGAKSVPLLALRPGLN